MSKPISPFRRISVAARSTPTSITVRTRQRAPPTSAPRSHSIRRSWPSTDPASRLGRRLRRGLSPVHSDRATVSGDDRPCTLGRGPARAAAARPGRVSADVELVRAGLRTHRHHPILGGRLTGAQHAAAIRAVLASQPDVRTVPCQGSDDPLRALGGDRRSPDARRAGRRRSPCLELLLFAAESRTARRVSESLVTANPACSMTSIRTVSHSPA